MTTTTLLLVRHGAHDLLDRALAGRLHGVGLNEIGRAQAQQLAARLARWPIRAVYASSLQRAQETALPLAGKLGTTPRTCPAFDEIDMGRWTGLTFDQLRDDPDWHHWNSRRGLARCPDGESFLEVQARVAAGLDELGRQHPDETVAIVSHADVIKAAITYLFGLPADFHARFEIAPISLSVAVHGKWGAKILKLNEEP